MNTLKHYITLVATLALIASLPLGAMRRTIKKTARRKMEELYQHGNSTTKQFLQTMNHLVTKNPNNSKKRIFITENISKMDIETLVFANSELESQAPSLSTYIKKEIQKKKLSLKTNKRKKENFTDKKKVKKKKTNNNEQKTYCPICLKNILKKDLETMKKITKLNCKHHFHKDCIKTLATKVKKDEFRKTFFACPNCRAECQIDTILTKEEINTLEHIGSLVEKASKGDFEAAEEIINNHTIVTNENFANIFIQASKRDSYHKIIKLFMANNTVMDKVGTANITAAFINTIHHVCIKNFEEFVKNEALFKTLQLSDSFKNICIAIYTGNYPSFNSTHNNILLTYKEFYKNFNPLLPFDTSELEAIITFSSSSTSRAIRNHFCNSIIAKKINAHALGSILIHAIKKGYNDIVQEFFSKNYTIKISNNDLGFIFAYAGKKNNLIVIQNFLNPQNKNLLEKIEKKDIGTAMMNASKHGYLESIKIFFKSDYILKEIDREDCKNLINATKSDDIKKFIEKQMPPKTWTQSIACNIQ